MMDATSSLVPRPLPDFNLQPIFLHSCEIKSGSGLGTRLCQKYVWLFCVILSASSAKQGCEILTVIAMACSV